MQGSCVTSQLILDQEDRGTDILVSIVTSVEIGGPDGRLISWMVGGDAAGQIRDGMLDGASRIAPSVAIR